jgi:ArsR family transcriptional regulator
MSDIEKLAEIFQILSDPTRLRLIRLLAQQPSGEDRGEPCNGGGFLCVNALAHRLGVTQSAVSQHLRLLRQVGLVRGERRGRFVHYSLNQDGLTLYKSILLEALGESSLAE